MFDKKHLVFAFVLALLLGPLASAATPPGLDSPSIEVSMLDPDGPGPVGAPPNEQKYSFHTTMCTGTAGPCGVSVF